MGQRSARCQHSHVSHAERGSYHTLYNQHGILCVLERYFTGLRASYGPVHAPSALLYSADTPRHVPTMPRASRPYSPVRMGDRAPRRCEPPTKKTSDFENADIKQARQPGSFIARPRRRGQFPDGPRPAPTPGPELPPGSSRSAPGQFPTPARIPCIETRRDGTR